MDSETIEKLRTKPSLIQRLKPRKTMCKECPHQYEVRTVSCHIGDLEMFCLEEPHICHSKRDGLCRGVVEKMIINNINWEVAD